MRNLLYAWYMPLLVVVRRVSCWDAISEDAARVRPGLLDALSKPQVRSVLYARLKASPVRWESVLGKIASRIWPGLRDFELVCDDIGPGLVIAHGYGAVIWAKRIGANCSIYQGVTLGLRNATGYPTLGDGVYVAPGAAILGPIHVGDGAQIGAGAVVLDDVPAGAVMVGVPARVLRATPGAATPAARTSG